MEIEEQKKSASGETEKRQQQAQAKALEESRAYAKANVMDVVADRTEGASLLFQVRWKQQAELTWESSKVIGDCPAYAKYVAHRAAELRRENKDGDPTDPARETLRKAMDALDNACNGLSGQILQRVLETEFKSSSMLVTIAGTEFRIHNCGSQATVEGLKHTNLCFYLSATADVNNEARRASIA